MNPSTWFRLAPTLSPDEVLSIQNVIEALGYRISWKESGYYLVTHREAPHVAPFRTVPHRLNPVRTRPFWQPDDGPEAA